MTSKQVMNSMDDYFEAQAQADKERNQALNKVVKEVCANVEFYTEGEDHVMKINFTATDGTYIRAISQKNEYCGRYMNLLADIWECEAKPADLRKIPAENIKKVYFYEAVRGENKSRFQEFRKPNAIEIAQYNSSLNTQKEA